MIDILFIIFLIIALSLIVFGWIVKTPPVTLGGYLVLFILGVVLLTGGLSYKTGETETYGYACGCCDNFTFNYGAVTYNCTGTPLSCDYYNGMSYECGLIGCTYNGTLEICSGTADDCELITDFNICNRYANCTWGEVESSEGCPNGTTMEMINKTLTNTYTNYDSEIYEGVQVNHVIGFFLCIIAVFGFVIVFMNLEKFDDKTIFRGER
jgi:hypothetical protein